MSPSQFVDLLPSPDAEELVDFTCATPWERLVLDVELKLREWSLHETAPLHAKGRVKLPSQPRNVCVTLGTRKLSLEHIPEHDEHIHKILGVGQCVVLGPPSAQSDAAVDASDAAVLLSALTAAAASCTCSLPMIVRVGPVDALRLIGRQGGERPRRFCCDYTNYPSGPTTQLPGILQLFHNKRVAARRMLAPSLNDPMITAIFTYYWSDFSFAVTAAPDSFANDPTLASIHRPVIGSSDPVPYLLLYVGWNPFHASHACGAPVTPNITGPVVGLTTRQAAWFRLAPPPDTFAPSASIPASFLPLTNYARGCLRLMNKASLKSSRPRPAAPRSLVDVHVAVSKTPSPGEPAPAGESAGRLSETKSAPALRSSSALANARTKRDSGRHVDESNVWTTAGPPKHAMDIFLAQVADFVAAAAVEDDKLDEDFLAGSVASLFGLDDSRGLVSEVVEALGPGVSEMTAIERISRLAAASGSVSMALRLWGLFLDGVEVHWRKLWLLDGVPVDPQVGPSMGECLILQKLEMLNCCILRLQENEQRQVSEKMQTETPQGLGRKKKLWPLRKMGSDGAKRKRAEGKFEDDNESEDANDGAGFVWEPCVQPLPYVTRDMVEAEQRKMVRNASLSGTGGGKSPADIKQQSSALKSDMMSFKAANPGATMSDFVRWFSPSDWVEDDTPAASQTQPTSVEGETEAEIHGSRSGRLSQRMRAPGNIWRELWDSVVPTRAREQVPLFDAHMHGLKALADLRAFPFKEVIRQFACMQASYASRILQRAFEKPPALPSIIAALATARQSCVSCKLSGVEEEAEALAAVADMCDKLATAEHMALGASSLVTKLPPATQFSAVINALVSGEPIDVHSERERSALSLVAGMEEDGWRSPLLPSYRQFILEGSDDDRMQVKISSDTFRVGVRLGLEYSTN